ncbi:MAG: hypothetical protein IKF93_08665 [Lachnospiraceae bacterium]|nr:hypothetical protein [Lachnospiraceae bacterium]
MNILIDYPSAAQYWLFRHDSKNDTKIRTQQIRYVSSFDESAVFISEKYGFDIPIHTSVLNKAHRNQGQLFATHFMAGCLPKNSFIQLERNIAVASPELCFLRASNILSFPALVVFACDLCASYSRSASDPFGQHSRLPVTSVAKIMAFLENVKNVKGIKTARTAIKYVLENSNSPMESKLAAISQLPISRGGFHLLKPDLNARVNLNESGKSLVKRDSLYCDMVWEEQKVVVEYDSNLSHLSKRQHFYDKQRITALNLSGYTVICITAENLRNFRSIEEIFYLLRSKLQMRSYSKEFEKTFDIRYSAVKDVFFSGNDLFLPANWKLPFMQKNDASDQIMR